MTDEPRPPLVASVALELSDEDRAKVDELRAAAGLTAVDWADPEWADPDLPGYPSVE